jgi:exodeoxyribonuclease VII small subunit
MTPEGASWGPATEPSPPLLSGELGERQAARADPAPSSYEAASGRLDEIVRRLDSGEAGLRETLELCQEGRRLVEFCAAELDAVGRGLEELRLEDLVARLEGGRTAA